MQSVHMHCVNLSIYLSIHLSIYISLSRYVCVYIFIYHSIYLSLYMIIIKRYCFQIQQLKLGKNKIYSMLKMMSSYDEFIFNWHFFVTSKVYIIAIKWHNFQRGHRGRFAKNQEVLHSENYVILLRNMN